MYVLDTNTVIDLFKGRGRVAERVLYELETGTLKSERRQKNRRQIEELAKLATLLPFGAAEARAAAGIRAGLEAQGRAIGPYDILIAATALARGEVLVTHNTEELGRVEGLRLEDWF